jgi:outer membrane protein assembly factor BamB
MHKLQSILLFPRIVVALSAAACLILAFSPPARADDWPQWLGPQRDGVWREDGLIEDFSTNPPPVRWSAEVGGGYAGPSVADGKVYAFDRQLAQGTANPQDPFARGKIPGSERLLCFDQRDGRLLWKFSYHCPYSVSYASGPRTTPLANGNRVYTLGAEGNLHCLNTADGSVAWSSDFKKDFGAVTPTWGFACNPLLDGNRLICVAGGTNATVAAFDASTGKVIWTALADKDPGYSSPMIYMIGGKRQLIVWTGQAVHGLDPVSGAVYWTEPFDSRYGMVIATPRFDQNRLFVTGFYDGSLMLGFKPEQSVPGVLWRSEKHSEKNTDALHSIICTPVFDGDYIYGVCSYGQLRCIKAADGGRVWETFQATVPSGEETRWANAFLIRQAARFFIFNEKGDLIIARLNPKGYSESSRAHLIDPVDHSPGRAVVWSHPAFAGRTVFVRNDKEIIALSLAK